MIAALYVAVGGTYYGLEDVEPWGLPERDAREYAGPWAVVAHPPCERWGRYWHGGPSAKVRQVRGADGGCFFAALHAVRTWGGVLEHPADSSAWAWFGLTEPGHRGAWVCADRFGGWTCRVDQGLYGHRARKATWLYACGVDALPSLRWERATGLARIDDGFHSAEERRAAKAAGWTEPERLTDTERAATPEAFRDLLLEIARSVNQTTTAHEAARRAR